MRTISKIVDDAEVTPALTETFGSIQKALKAPFTPNFFQVWGTSEESLNGKWTLRIEPFDKQWRLQQTVQLPASNITL